MAFDMEVEVFRGGLIVTRARPSGEKCARHRGTDIP